MKGGTAMIPIVAQAATTLWSELSTVFTALISWTGEVLTAITSGSLAGLLPFLAIPIGFTLIGFGVGLIKRVIG